MPSSHASKLRLAGFLTAIAVILLDQLSKQWVLQIFADDPARHLELARTGPVGLDLVLWWNRGISFGLLHLPSAYMPLILSGSALLVCAFLAIWLWRAARDNPSNWLTLALGLIIGGALGNVIDRLQHGAVVDFIYVYWRDHYWPAFNIADSCICIGVCMLIFSNLKAGAQLGKAAETA